MLGVVKTLLDGASATGAGSSVEAVRGVYQKSMLVTLSGATPNADVNLEGSHDGATWAVLGTLNLSSASTGKIDDTGAWPFLRANVTAVNGSVDATLCF